MTSREKLDELERLAKAAMPKGVTGDWYVVESPWLPRGCEPYIVCGSPDPRAGEYVCDFVDASIAGVDDHYTDEEWSSRNWALAEFIAAADPCTVLALIERVRSLEGK